MTVSASPLSLIAAMARNRVIGDHGRLPWDEPEDLQHFKRLSTGHAVIMGRLTAASLRFKPLRGRRNLVISRNPALDLPGFEVFSDLGTAIAEARRTDVEPMIIGGAEIYRLALPLVTTMYLTEIQRECAGDALFPEFAAEDWRESERRESGALVFRTLVRTTPTIPAP
jgi:dihydrofolate reductase